MQTGRELGEICAMLAEWHFTVQARGDFRVPKDLVRRLFVDRVTPGQLSLFLQRLAEKNPKNDLLTDGSEEDKLQYLGEVGFVIVPSWILCATLGEVFDETVPRKE